MDDSPLKAPAVTKSSSLNDSRGAEAVNAAVIILHQSAVDTAASPVTHPSVCVNLLTCVSRGREHLQVITRVSGLMMQD